MLTVLNVSSPLAQVGETAVGGAEVILTALDRALTAAGHRSLVLAQAGAKIAGELVPVTATYDSYDEASIAKARRRHQLALRGTLESRRVDVVHLHGHDFEHYLPEPGPPVLVTLHCPLACYGPKALQPDRPRTWLHAVSERQHRTLPASPNLLPPIENGVEIPPPSQERRSSYALVLSRISPDKGIHVALQCARAAGLPMIVAGQVLAYPEHERYFTNEIDPLLDAVRHFIGPVSGERRRRLLARARCLVVPSLEETSCIVAREALASGTPVVAFASGALADIIEHGVTGFLVDDAKSMPKAMVDAVGLDHDRCRMTALNRFPLERMVERYFGVYEQLARAPAT